MDSSMCSSVPDPQMWIIQGTLAWRIDGAIRLRSNVDPAFDSLVASGRSRFSEEHIEKEFDLVMCG
ncbi:uncharacterized protein ycf68 [Phtheirospermum japonicum]|uniref:Uncharacterized protein ycf68 n=1 Tax=Phtheirospermum japonicum TaxID=374723 RepID=A0A830CYY9_9LAMI|nr:uncharacterized protein ycf68 [Phtheirospermum japonicum]